MSVLLETTEGDIIIDLEVEQAPKLCNNFLKLCKAKYYNFCPFYNIQKDFSCQSGDPLYPLGDGGSSVWGLINNDGRGIERRFFVPDTDSSSQRLRHDKIGTISMPLIPNNKDDEMVVGSQFLITLADNLDDQLHKTAAVFGQVVEGFDTLETINKSFCDDMGRPYKDIRIKHTYVLEDPLDDIEGLDFPPTSPEPSEKQLSTVRLSGTAEKPEQEEIEDDIAARKRDQEARAQALTLEIIGDLPHAEVKPEENVLFVCKLNPVTKDEDLELIFSRFGNIISCEIVRDFETGNSLQYGFIEFENQADCERAYMKMEGVLIDDNRIHVDFSQSVSKLSGAWRNKVNLQRERKHGRSFTRSSFRAQGNSCGREKTKSFNQQKI
ncbi:cyclophilin-like protein [Nadsonia fulvescens var. elongata DSM 6958]|uniref:Peptidyl-prolyl cis-trans isomerase n=1 Tax=Nadsonia fulvescens var. elongata DSM 6958 TaxID=857566 RepID=A0A1E3PM52_9ASCO|nr:cyclophilin-like protein [Nadsonia fulvescens var. elongata DSM 6958]